MEKKLRLLPGGDTHGLRNGWICYKEALLCDALVRARTRNGRVGETGRWTYCTRRVQAQASRYGRLRMLRGHGTFRWPASTLKAR